MKKSTAEESWDAFHGEIQPIMEELLPGDRAFEEMTAEELVDGRRTEMKMGDIDFLGSKDDAPLRIPCTHTTYNIHMYPRPPFYS